MMRVGEVEVEAHLLELQGDVDGSQLSQYLGWNDHQVYLKVSIIMVIIAHTHRKDKEGYREKRNYLSFPQRFMAVIQKCNAIVCYSP